MNDARFPKPYQPEWLWYLASFFWKAWTLWIFISFCQAQPKLRIQLSWAEIALLSQLWGTYDTLRHLFIICSWLLQSNDLFMTCPWLVHDLFKTCSRLVHDLGLIQLSTTLHDLFTIVYNLFMTQFFHDLSMTCSWLVHYLFMTLFQNNIQLVHYLFMTWSQ